MWSVEFSEIIVTIVVTKSHSKAVGPNTQKSILAGVLPQTPLGKLTTVHQSL